MAENKRRAKLSKTSKIVAGQKSWPAVHRTSAPVRKRKYFNPNTVF